MTLFWPSCTCCGQCVVLEDTFDNLDNWDIVEMDASVSGSQAVISSGLITSVLSDSGGGRVSFYVTLGAAQYGIFSLETADPDERVTVALHAGDADGSPCGWLEINQGTPGTPLLSRFAYHHMIHDGNKLRVRVYWTATRVIAYVQDADGEEIDPHFAVASNLNKVNVAVDLLLPLGEVKIGLASDDGTATPPPSYFEDFEWLRREVNGAHCFRDDFCGSGFGAGVLPFDWMYEWDYDEWEFGSTPKDERCDAVVTDSGDPSHPLKIEVQSAYVTEHDRQNGYFVVFGDSGTTLDSTPGEYYLSRLEVGDLEVRLYGISETGNQYLKNRIELYESGVLVDSRTYSTESSSFSPVTYFENVTLALSLSVYQGIACVGTGYPFGTKLQATVNTTQTGSDIVAEIMPDGDGAKILAVWAFRCWTCQGCTSCEEQAGSRELLTPLQLSVTIPDIPDKHLCAVGTFVCEYMNGVPCTWLYTSAPNPGELGIGVRVTLIPSGAQWRLKIEHLACDNFGDVVFLSDPFGLTDCSTFVDVPCYFTIGSSPPVTYTAYITAL